VKRRYFRGDAAFANPEIYEFLEAEGYGYAIRLPTNPVLQGKIGYQRWPGESGQGDKWIFCLRAARIAADQERA
jgi:hypothetical protein